LLVAIRTE